MTSIGGETETLEFKKTTAEAKAATDSIVAMLNRCGRATVLFGVKDDGTVIGQQVTPKTKREVAQAIRNRISPAVHPEVRERVLDEKTCLEVVVSGCGSPTGTA